MLTTACVGSTDDETLRDAATASTGELLSRAARVGHWKNFATADFGPLLHADAAWTTLTEPRAVKILTPILTFGDGLPYLSITRARQR